MYKLVAIDLDGSLLNNRHEISVKNLETIRRCRELGCEFVLISGREIESLKYYSDRLGLNNFLTAFNGSLITNHLADKIVYNRTLNTDLARTVLKSSYKSDKFIIVFLDHEVLVSDGSSYWYDNYLKYTVIRPKVVDNIIDYLDREDKFHRINKLCFSDDHSELLRFQGELDGKLDGEFTLLFSLPFFLEAFRRDTSKGIALEFLAREYGVARENIIAIGDGENDISMIEYAGLGIAMENASDKLKARADFITLDNENDGVSHALEKWILER